MYIRVHTRGKEREGKNKENKRCIEIRLINNLLVCEIRNIDSNPMTIW